MKIHVTAKMENKMRTFEEILEETCAGNNLSADCKIFVELVMGNKYDWSMCYDEESIQPLNDLYQRYIELSEDLSRVMRAPFSVLKQ
jgi:hypothetical protein